MGIWAAAACGALKEYRVKYGTIEKYFGISSLEKDSLKVDNDGPVDLYFVPSVPKGHESNWIPTCEKFWVCFDSTGQKSHCSINPGNSRISRK